MSSRWWLGSEKRTAWSDLDLPAGSSANTDCRPGTTFEESLAQEQRLYRDYDVLLAESPPGDVIQRSLLESVAGVKSQFSIP
jgi:hypothetical protein